MSFLKLKSLTNLLWLPNPAGCLIHMQLCLQQTPINASVLLSGTRRGTKTQTQRWLKMLVDKKLATELKIWWGMLVTCGNHWLSFTLCPACQLQTATHCYKLLNTSTHCLSVANWAWRNTSDLAKGGREKHSQQIVHQYNIIKSSGNFGGKIEWMEKRTEKVSNTSGCMLEMVLHLKRK